MMKFICVDTISEFFSSFFLISPSSLQICRYISDGPRVEWTLNHHFCHKNFPKRFNTRLAFNFIQQQWENQKKIKISYLTSVSIKLIKMHFMTLDKCDSRTRATREKRAKGESSKISSSINYTRFWSEARVSWTGESKVMRLSYFIMTINLVDNISIIVFAANSMQLILVCHLQISRLDGFYSFIHQWVKRG